jgi:TfoX/Sxy family transcriptional regulator of competence genes
MKFAKASPELVDTFAAVFAAVLPAHAGAEKRQMFGYPCGFVNGHMFAGLFADSLFVRVTEADQKALVALGGTPFAPMANRPMRGYLCVPAAMHKDASSLKHWLGKAATHAASLPAKVKKPGVKMVAARAKTAKASKATATKKH